MKEMNLQLTKHTEHLKSLVGQQSCNDCILMKRYFTTQYEELKNSLERMERLSETNSRDSFTPNISALHQSVAMVGLYVHV